MNAKELRQFMLGEREPSRTIEWLQQTFLPNIVEHLNTNDVRRRLGIYGGERIPENERNLTDVRNRTSLIIEYETARIASRLLENAGVEDVFLTYVVANRFPDIEVRSADGARGLRFEIKCLQSVAEEKSANFDTLKKDIHPGTDYLVVFLWEWNYDPADIKWDRAPKILRSYCFNASALAHLRDWYWLNQPPVAVGGGLQGFDLRYAVNCRDGNYNEEEGNYGKLLRIWTEDFKYEPVWNPLLKRTEEDYLSFKSDVIVSGFDTLSGRMLRALSGAEEISSIVVEGERVGWQAGDVAFVLSARVDSERKRNALNALPLKRRFFFSDKYAWYEETVTGGVSSVIRRGRKPKHLILTADQGGN